MRGAVPAAARVHSLQLRTHGQRTRRRRAVLHEVRRPSKKALSLLLRLTACPKLQASLFGGPGSAVRTSERHVGYMGAPHPRPRLQRPRIGAGARWMRGWDVSRHDIAGIWVAFFQECQQYRRGQG